MVLAVCRIWTWTNYQMKLRWHLGGRSRSRVLRNVRLQPQAKHNRRRRSKAPQHSCLVYTQKPMLASQRLAQPQVPSQLEPGMTFNARTFTPNSSTAVSSLVLRSGDCLLRFL